MPNRDDIVSAARECIGTPFKVHGRIAGKALDCAGVIIHVGLKLGFLGADYTFTDYGSTPDAAVVNREAARQLKPIAVADMKKGSVLCLGATHYAIVVELEGELGILHGSKHFPTVTQHRIDDFWRRKIVRAYDFIGVED